MRRQTTTLDTHLQHSVTEKPWVSDRQYLLTFWDSTPEIAKEHVAMFPRVIREFDDDHEEPMMCQG